MCVPACAGVQIELELMRAKAAEAHLLDIARSEARERRKSEEEVARLTTVVNDGYSKIASVEAMAQQLQDSMNARMFCNVACLGL